MIMYVSKQMLGVFHMIYVGISGVSISWFKFLSAGL